MGGLLKIDNTATVKIEGILEDAHRTQIFQSVWLLPMKP